MPIAALLEELFTLHGHQVTQEAPLEGMSGTVYTIPVLAESAGQAIVVSGLLDGSPVTARAVAEFADTVRDVGADLGILVHTGPREPGALEAADGKVALWDRDQVVFLLGEAQVARSLEETPDPLPLAPGAVAYPGSEAVAQAPTSVSEMLPQAFLAPETALPEPGQLADDSVTQPVLADFFAAVEADPVAPPLEAPRKPRPARPQDDDLQPFPPIAPQALPEFAPPPPLEFYAPLPPMLPPMPVAEPAFPPAPEPVTTTPTAAPLAPPRVAHPVAVATMPWAPAAMPAAPRTFLPPMAPATGAQAAQAVPAGIHAPSAFSSLFGSVQAPAHPRPMPQPPAPAPMSVAPSLPPAPIAATPALALPAAPPAPSAPFPAASKPVLPVRIRVEEAKRRVKDRLFSVRSVEILLQPVHVFDYECDILREGSLSFDTADGRIQVHGSDKSTLDIDPDQTNPNAPTFLAGGHPYPVEERVLRIAEDRAQQLAVQHVTKKHVRSVSIRVADHNNGLYYTEKRKVEPTPDQIRLRAVGIYLRPVWRLHGSNGIVDVDATDGREVMCELRGARSDAMLIE